MNGKIRLFAVLLALIISSSANARPKIGLALSGGGARGVAHVGVLKVLEEHNVPIDYIAGTSMGALVGGLYASGYSTDEIVDIVVGIDWSDVLDDEIPRRDQNFKRKRDDDLYLIKNKAGIDGTTFKFPQGILDGQKIDLILKENTLSVVTIRDFDRLAIPFRCVAADIVTGEAVILRSGDLALALRASMALPSIFTPREIDGKLLVDGGVSRNLPIDVVREMGADIVIAVDISTPLQKREEINSALAITNQITGFLTRKNADMQIGSLTEDDIFILPDLGDITTGSFARSLETIPIGIEAAESVSEALSDLSLTAGDYEEHMRGRSIKRELPVIHRIRIENDSKISDGVIEAMLHVEIGKVLDPGTIRHDLTLIYGLELFDSVYYDITEESGGNVLTVYVKDRNWGPNYIQFGMAVFEDYEGPNFNVSVSHLRTELNRLNGEWRTGIQAGQEPGIYSELYQPIDFGLDKFIEIRGSYSDYAENLFDPDGHKYSEVGILRYGGRIALGRELGTWGRFSLGVLKEKNEFEYKVGDPGIEEEGYDTGEAFTEFYIDELDDLHFPRAGGTLRLRFAAALEALGSDTEYRQVSCGASMAGSLGICDGLISFYGATTLDGETPFYNLFRLGGFTRLSGLEQNELKGQHAVLVVGKVYRKIADLGVIGVNAGLSVEYGNVFQDRSEIDPGSGVLSGSLFLGLTLPVGPPIYLVYGRSEGDRDNFYFTLGIPFNISGSSRNDR